jgi:hypothetical protein
MVSLVHGDADHVIKFSIGRSFGANQLYCGLMRPVLMSRGRAYKFLIFHGSKSYISSNLSLLIISEVAERETKTSTDTHSDVFFRLALFYHDAASVPYPIWGVPTKCSQLCNARIRIFGLKSCEWVVTIPPKSPRTCTVHLAPAAITSISTSGPEGANMSLGRLEPWPGVGGRAIMTPCFHQPGKPPLTTFRWFLSLHNHGFL